jgi:hypothetical protein
MSAPGTAKSRVDTEDKPAAYAWSFPGAPIRILIDLQIVAEIRHRMDGVPPPVTGLLLGSVNERTVHIHKIVALLRGDAEEIETAISANASLPESMAVGYYVAEAKDSLRLDAAQIEFAERFFQPPHSVVLLVQTGSGPIPNASFFFWDSGKFLGDFAFLEFPFDGTLLENEAAIDAPEQLAGITAQQVVLERNGVRSALGGRKAVSVLAAASLLLALGAVGVWSWSKSRPRVAPAGSSAPEPPINIGLRAERSGTDFRLTWDRSSQIVRTAVSGTLSIQDGGNKRAVSLYGDELRSGSALLQPQNANVQVQLSLVMPDQSVRSESVLLLLTQTGPIKIERQAAASKPKVDLLTPDISNPGVVPEAVKPVEVATRNATPPKAEVQPLRAPEPVKEEILEAPPVKVDTSALPRRFPYIAALPVVLPAPVEKPSPPPSIPQPTIYKGPEPIGRPKPALTDALRAFLRRETTVSVQVRVDERGFVTRADVIQFPGLSQYVAKVVQNTALMWRFRPAERNGLPVQSEFLIGFQFKP